MDEKTNWQSLEKNGPITEYNEPFPEQVKCTSFDDVKLTDDGLKLTLPKCSVLHLTVTVK